MRTMDAPSISYTKTQDGVRIACWGIGRGPPLVQLPGLPYSHIEVEWQIPELRRCYVPKAEGQPGTSAFPGSFPLAALRSVGYTP